MPSAMVDHESSTIGKYQLLANLGHGGMADVYLAVARGPVGFNKLTVIKKLRPSLADEPEFLTMFLDEARLAARLNHPNVVQTNEVAEVGGVFFIAMEYLDGQPLNRILHRVQKLDAPPRELLLRVVADALAGLHHAHELEDYDGTPLHVVHRDASPHNIFVTYDGQTKVVDFGIAKAASRSAETRDGVLKGKVAYMAPEQSRSEHVDRRADIFAMGLVMWEVLTGSRLRRGSDIEILDRIARGDVPSLSSAWPDCPPALEAIVARATALSARDRYPTALEMRQDILAHLDAVPVRSTSEDVGRLVTSMFEHKRAEMKGIIERQLSGLSDASTFDSGLRVVDARRLVATDSIDTARDTGPSMPRVSPSSHPAMSDAPRTPTGRTPAARTPISQTPAAQAPILRSDVVPSATAMTAAEGEAPRHRARAPVIIAVVGVAAAVTVLALNRGGDQTPATPSAGPGAAASSPPSAGAAVGAQQPAATVEVRITARPEQARMFLDGSALSTNPFVGRFRRDDQGHTLRIEAEGHATLTRTLSFASDQTLELTLERESTGKKAGPGAQPQVAPSAAASAAPSAAPSAAEDDDKWLPGKAPQKKLDDDPFR